MQINMYFHFLLLRKYSKEGRSSAQVSLETLEIRRLHHVCLLTIKTTSVNLKQVVYIALT